MHRLGKGKISVKENILGLSAGIARGAAEESQEK
jgi:hypothetical protein